MNRERKFRRVLNANPVTPPWARKCSVERIVRFTVKLQGDFGRRARLREVNLGV